jgi:hypothetical protein
MDLDDIEYENLSIYKINVMKKEEVYKVCELHSISIDGKNILDLKKELKTKVGSKIAPELREQAVKEQRHKVDQENPNSSLTKNDVRGLKFDSSVVEQGLQELNVEIFKRIVRNKYPHKFA